MTDDDLRIIISTAPPGDRIVAAAMIVLHGFARHGPTRAARKRQDRTMTACREACAKWLEKK